MARMVGKFAVKQGQTEATKAIGKASEQATARLNELSRPAGSNGPAVKPRSTAPAGSPAPGAADVPTVTPPGPPAVDLRESAPATPAVPPTSPSPEPASPPMPWPSPTTTAWRRHRSSPDFPACRAPSWKTSGPTRSATAAARRSSTGLPSCSRSNGSWKHRGGPLPMIVTGSSSWRGRRSPSSASNGAARCGVDGMLGSSRCPTSLAGPSTRARSTARPARRGGHHRRGGDRLRRGAPRPPSPTGGCLGGDRRSLRRAWRPGGSAWVRR